MKARQWLLIRQLTQIFSLGLFLYLFVITALPTITAKETNIFFQLNPLTTLIAFLAGNYAIPYGLALLTVVVTLVFGRVWCGWFCPLGTLLEWLSLHPKRIIKRGSSNIEVKPPPESWRKLKGMLLLVLIFAALVGNQSLIFLDPITLLNRSLSTALFPALRYAVFQTEAFLYHFPWLWDGLDSFHQFFVYPLFQDVTVVFQHGLLIFVLFALVVGLNLLTERFWCRYLCPLGAIFGYLSKMALFQRRVSNQCSACGLCSARCPTGTIDAQNDYRSDPMECTVCYECFTACARQDISYRAQREKTEKYIYDISRRDAFYAFATALGSVALAGLEPIHKRAPEYLIRPPGSLKNAFDSLCIRCGECVRVCPTQGLQPTLNEAGWQNIFTPHLVPRLGYCSYSCNACGEICPSGAIPSLAIAEKRSTAIGLAYINHDRCLPWAYATPCIVCEEACPLPEKAIRLEEAILEDGSSLQRPKVLLELCIGCGICEFQCPMGGEAAIRVTTWTEVSRVY